MGVRATGPAGDGGLRARARARAAAAGGGEGLAACDRAPAACGGVWARGPGWGLAALVPSESVRVGRAVGRLHPAADGWLPQAGRDLAPWP
jgi:hypothetical protein